VRGGAPGDLFVRLQVRNDPRFHREGVDEGGEVSCNQHPVESSRELEGI
jgi:DnaJ-class molecular chaperone